LSLQVGAVSELRISVRRLGAFLALLEPPEPWHTKASPRAAPSGDSSHQAAAAGGEGSHVWPAGQQQQQQQQQAAAVEVSGADFDWADRSWAEAAGADRPAAAATTSSSARGSKTVAAAAPPAQAASAAPPPSAFQLRRLSLAVPRGKLVAIVGAVGSGALPAAAGELSQRLQSLPPLKRFLSTDHPAKFRSQRQQRKQQLPPCLAAPLC
jgi:hypothetical protein